jgi:hypothetical protein
VDTRAPVAPQVLGWTPRGSEFLRILTAFVLSVVGDVPVGSSEAPVCGGFVNLEDLPARSPKMLLGVGVCVRVFIGIVNVSVVLCNSQKKKNMCVPTEILHLRKKDKTTSNVRRMSYN